MDSPVKELQRMRERQEQAAALLGEGRHPEALAAVDEALTIEEQNTRSLSLKADILGAMGRGEEAERLRALVRQLRKEAWRRQVEAEIRGHHDLWGEAIRHENL